MELESFNSELLEFLDNSVTPFHAVECMKKMLDESGFIELNEKNDLSKLVSGKYFIIKNNSSIIAFNYKQGDSAYLLLGAHTDSPTLKVKPNPVIKKEHCVQLGVEPYGGLLLAPWFDRDLALAGEVVFVDENDKIQRALIDTSKAIATIASLAIHLDRDVHSARAINAQTDIVPIISSNMEFDFDEFIKGELQKQDLHMSKLLSHNLDFYDTQKASFIGLEDEFISSARLDNLLSCYIAIKTLIGSENNMIVICSDHEEVGSSSVGGAAGPFLEHTLKRVFKDNFYEMIADSLLISCDNAHAVHPNFTSKHDENHVPYINGGVVVKINSNQRYATSPLSSAKFLHTASKLELSTQNYVTRSDMGCGSTIGPITAAKLGINTLDIGLPTFAMHSIRELAGSKDAHELYQILLSIEL